MQLYKVPPSLKYHPDWIAVEGLRLEEPLKIDQVLNQLQTITETHEVPLQIIDARYLCGPRHAFHAGNLALAARHKKRARANRIEIEILLYLTGRRQIGEAIKSIGVRNDAKEIAVIALGSSEKAVQGALNEVAEALQGLPDDKLLEISKTKRVALQKLFNVTDDELAIVTRNGDWKEGLLKCVMERGAMLDALKK